MNELDHWRDYFALKGAEAEIRRLEMKHSVLPEDIPAWLDERESFFKKLPNGVIEYFEKDIVRIDDARYQYSLGNMDKLKWMMIGIEGSVRNALDDWAHFDIEKHKIVETKARLKKLSDEQAIWRDRAPILQAKMAELRAAKPNESYSCLYKRLKKFTKKEFDLEIGLSSAKKYAPDPNPRPRKNNRLGL